MAKPILSGIHLVPKVPPKPQPLDPASIAAEVLKTVRECSRALSEFQDWQEYLTREMAARLNQLEVTALRTMTRKARRS